MANRIQQCPPVAADSFHQFYKLADEIRLMIWEYTWPAPRLIEAALFDNPEAQEEMEGDEEEETEGVEEEETEVVKKEEAEGDEEEEEEEEEEETEVDEEEMEEPSEIVNLRLAGSLSTMLKSDLGSRIVEGGPVEHCPDPVALQVCQQSRMHALSRYRVMTSLGGHFYYHPQRDVIFFSIDVADDYPIHMPFLERYHKTELNTFETLLVLECEWPGEPVEKGPRSRGMDYTLDCISHLGSLRTIQILWEKSSGSEDSMELDDDGEEDSPENLAERLRLSFSSIIRHEKCTAERIEVMDIDGKLY